MNELTLTNSLESLIPYTFLATTFFEVIRSIYEVDDKKVFSIHLEDMHKVFMSNLSNLDISINSECESSDDVYSQQTREAFLLGKRVKNELLKSSVAVRNEMLGSFDDDNVVHSLESVQEEDIMSASFRWSVYFQQAIINISDEVNVEVDGLEKTASLMLLKGGDAWKFVFKGYEKDVYLHEAYLNNFLLTSDNVDDISRNPTAHFLSQIGRFFIWEAQQAIKEINESDSRELFDHNKEDEFDSLVKDPYITVVDKIQ